MNASERPAVPREADHLQERRATPSAHTVTQGHRSNRRTLPQNPVGPHVPDEGAPETFIGGARI
jgi:hypothetical protein